MQMMISVLLVKFDVNLEYVISMQVLMKLEEVHWLVQLLQQLVSSLLTFILKAFTTPSSFLRQKEP